MCFLMKPYLFILMEFSTKYQGDSPPSILVLTSLCVASFQFFQCVETPLTDTGGETTFCNTIKIINEASPQQIEQWKDMRFGYYTPKSAYFGGSKVCFNMIEKHPHANNKRTNANSNKEVLIFRY